ncbi:MAG: gamma-glutamyl-gamma-aminobutyrate hydrolase family protein [Candidatus Bathyarchaeota archaeon]|nr:gamma-glutamyl-gamma-aminobutyrate hydrolase family protein [Candidatus Bathyarchaeota archaeon]
MLAICQGAQVLNVAVGGTLIQDTNSQVEKPLKHRQEALAEYGPHIVNIKQGTKLYEVFGEKTLLVNTFHHQAVKDSGKGVTVTASADDGVIEAYEMNVDQFVVGVQWHPEYMESMNRLFSAFIQAC